MYKSYITSNLIVAIAYIITGQLGLMLSVPPSNSAVVWPAAGVALASIIILGPKILFGLFIGCFFVQTTSYLDASTTEKLITSLLVGATISLGAVLQAWVGAKLTHHIFVKDSGLLKERSILSFCVLAGPVSCIISPTIGFFVLWFFGILSAVDLPYSWSTWWIGDSIGVLLFSPILLCFFGNPRYIWKQRITNVAIPLLIFSSVAFFAFKLSHEFEFKRIEKVFEKNSTLFRNDLIKSLNIHLRVAEGLKDFFDSSKVISGEKFSQYTQPKISRHPEIQAIEWIPLILHKNRKQFEEKIGTDIKIPDAGGKMIPSPIKETYFPVEYLEPYMGNENALGFDIHNNSLAMKVTQDACDSGQVVMSDSLKLVQEKNEQRGVVFYAPVYRKNSEGTPIIDCKKILGFTANVFRLENEINKIHDRHPDLKVSVTLMDEGKTFYSDVLEADEVHIIPNHFQLELKYDLPIVNQNWQMVFSPKIGFISLYSTWSVWFVIIGGLFISAISGVGLLMLTGRALQTEGIVNRRTTELNKEIMERKHITEFLQIENKCLEMSAQDVSLTEIFEVITKSIEKMIPETKSSILLLDASGRYLKNGSAPSLPKGYTEIIDGIEIGPEVGSCGTAVYYNKPVIVNDIANDLLWKNYKDLAFKYGLKACWSIPIKVANGKILGTFALYFETVKKTDEKVIALLNRIANIAAIAILRKQAESQLVFNASHDALTGLVNRSEFERKARHLLESVKKEHVEHALCFMDLDQFKVVNDSCGHTAGDEMLRQITSALQSVVRNSDTLARLGGDEFGILLVNCSLDQANKIASHLQKVIQDYVFTWHGQSFRVGVSIGMVAINEKITNLNELMKGADAACYMAKDLGRNRIHVYHPDDTEIVLRHGEMQWVTKINQALDENRFCLYIQEIKSLHGNCTDNHYELLIRMLDNEKKTILPEAFLPAAERYDLMSKIDLWVIHEAFTLLEDNPVFLNQTRFISINLSGQSLANYDILNFIISKINNTKIDAHKICFEITETAAIANLSMAMEFISKLKDIGFQFALDDFGSGLSSFAYLKNLPVDYLKIDGIFVKDIIDDPIDRAMVKSINEIGQIMSMKTIAEFVENDEIKEILSEIGVDYIQGYCINKPQLFQNLLNQNV